MDRGSWVEMQRDWARTVIVGRARLGGCPVGEPVSLGIARSWLDHNLAFCHWLEKKGGEANSQYKH